MASTTIAVDGEFGDWAGVKANPANSIGDTVLPEDPDYPGQPDRDIFLSNVTYDDEFLYLSWNRTASGSKAITFGAYIDKDGDGKLADGDLVVNWVVSTGQPHADAHAPSPSAWILRYNQARTKNGNVIKILNPGGDNLGNMGADGDTPDGWAAIQDGQFFPAKPMDAALSSANGIECEARVAWSDLGLAPDSPINLHIASGNGNAWGTKYAPSTSWKWVGSPAQYLEENRGQVEDNCGGTFSFSRRAVILTPDNNGSAGAGSWVTYSHTLSNTGNVSTTFDLTAKSAHGWATQVTNAIGSEITSTSLAAGGSATVLCRVFVPEGITVNTRDTAILSAAMHDNSSVSATAVDRTVVGLTAVYPDRAGSMAPGQTIEYSFTVSNSTGNATVLELATSSSLSFSGRILSPAGASISSVSLASGESTTVVVRVSVPSTATPGAQDVTRLTAAPRGESSETAFAMATTKVMADLDISPNRTAEGGEQAFVTYRHTVTNSWPTSRSVTIATTDAHGWPVAVYDADGATRVTSLALGPNGDTREVYVRVFVPSGTPAGTSDTVTVRATSGDSTDFVLDTTVVRRLTLYDSAAYGSQSTVHDQGDTVYALGAGLGAYANVYFVWRDSGGTIVRTSPSRTVDTRDMAYDRYTIPDTAAPGDWTCELRNAKNDALLETSMYQVRQRAEISALWSSTAARIGENVTIDSTHANHSAAAIIDSVATFIIWWDTDHDGTLNAGDLWVDSSGVPHPYDGAAAVSTHVTSGIDVAANGGTWDETAWSLSNTHFPNQGTYRVTETWTSAVGAVIDIKTTEFFSVPTLGEWMNELAQSGTRSLPPILLGGALWLALTFWLYRTRRWLRMYLTGAFGFVMFVLFFSQALGWDTALQALEARNALFIAAWLQMRLELLGASGLAIRNHVGWGVFDIGIECSALLEMAAFAGLVAFYPGFRSGRKGWTLAIGLIATYSINIARILIIVGMVAMLGTSWVFIAHAVVGRVFFFIGIVIVYWYLMTRPSVRAVGVKLDPDIGEEDSRG